MKCLLLQTRDEVRSLCDALVVGADSLSDHDQVEAVSAGDFRCLADISRRIAGIMELAADLHATTTREGWRGTAIVEDSRDMIVSAYDMISVDRSYMELVIRWAKANGKYEAEGKGRRTAKSRRRNSIPDGTGVQNGASP